MLSVFALVVCCFVLRCGVPLDKDVAVIELNQIDQFQLRSEGSNHNKFLGD